MRPRNEYIYIASRVKHAARWRGLRNIEQRPIISSWIDEAGDDESVSFGGLWERIVDEVRQSRSLILYVEPDDFPLKGALVEVGIAFAHRIPVIVCAPGVICEDKTQRPLGSWILAHKVVRVDNLDHALGMAQVGVFR